MPNLERIKLSIDDVEIVAVVVSRTVHGNLHAGIAHRETDGTISVLHLAWDCDLRRDPGCQDIDAFALPFFVVPEIASEEADLVATMCRRIYATSANNSISYCVGTYPQSDAYFKDGVFTSTDPRIGLNCSAFVVRVFEDAKVPLVDMASWPSRPDRDLPNQRKLIAVMEMILAKGLPTTLTQGKIDFNKAQLGKMCRVAPEEVAGACLEPGASLPAPCIRCQDNGELIVQWLDMMSCEFFRLLARR